MAENIRSVNDLADFVANFEMIGDEEIYNYTDGALHELYSSVKNNYVLKGNNQTFN